MAWRTLEPIAELAAIDFAEGAVYLEEDSWRLSREKSLTPSERRKADKRKASLVEAVISQYPPDFGGYHASRFGSFQNAIRQAWDAYN